MPGSRLGNLGCCPQNFSPSPRTTAEAAGKPASGKAERVCSVCVHMGWYKSLPSLCIYLVPRKRVRALVIGRMDLLKAEDIILGLLPLEA